MSRLPASAAMLATVVIAGCGGDNGAGRTATVAGTKPVEITGREYSFDPENITVTGGGAPLELVLDNKGSLAHDARVLSGDRDLGGTPVFTGGKKRSAKIALQPGEYELICSVGNHEELGMKGTLRIE